MSSFHKAKSIILFALIVLVLGTVAWQPQKASASGGGSAYFTDGGYAGPTTVYSYIVDGARAYTCGALHLIRNGVPESTGIGWICTDGNGHAENGPWGPPTENEYASDIYIEWLDGTETNHLTHINCVHYYQDWYCPFWW